MTTVASKHGLRAAATEKRNRHAQRTALPPRPGQVEAAKADDPPIGDRYGQMTQLQLLARAIDLGLNPPKSAPKGKLLDAILAAERSARHEDKIEVNRQESVPSEPKGLAKAQKLAAEGRPAGWESVISGDGAAVTVTLTRGSEAIVIRWDGGVFNYDESAYIVGDRSVKPRNVSAARVWLGRAAETATAELQRVTVTRWRKKTDGPAKAAVGLSPDASEREIWESLKGKRITWFNRHSSGTESAKLTVNPRYFRLTEVAGERIIQFTSVDGGFRACRVEAILSIRR